MPHATKACIANDVNKPRLDHLGECLGEYQGNLIRSPLYLLGLGAGTLICGGFAYRLVADSGYIWSVEQGMNAGAVFLGLGALVCLVLLVGCCLGANCKLWLLEQGFVYRQGKQITEARWDQVAALYESAAISETSEGTLVNTSHKQRIRMADGRIVKLNLSFFDNSDEASQIITAHTFPRLLSECKAALARREKIDFEKVKLSREGISQSGLMGGEDTLTWDQIGEAKIENGYLVVNKGNVSPPWNWTAVADIPNFRVLYAFLNHFVNKVALPEAGELPEARHGGLLVAAEAD
jgi:hypothetical protein